MQRGLSALHVSALGARSRHALAVTSLVSIVSGVAALLSWGHGFPDPDVYYHAALASQISHGEVVRHFTWLPLTVLAQSFADHHFLLHVFEAPFVALGGLTGIKVTTALLASLSMVVYYEVLRRYRVPGAFWWTILAFITAPFLFRLNLVKALSLSLIFYLLGLSALVERRQWRLFFISALYVWAYGGWPLLWVTSLIIVPVRVCLEKKLSREMFNGFFAASAGSLVGLVVNPWFPQNVVFYWYQVVEIALAPGGNAAAGQEWSSLDPAMLFPRILPLVMAFLVVLLVGFFALSVEPKRLFQGSQVGSSGRLRFLTTGMAVLFLIATMLSRRYVEYLVPLGFLSVSLWAAYLSELGVWRALFESMKQNFRRETTATFLLLYLLGVTVGGYFFVNDYQTYEVFRASSPVQTLKSVAEHLSVVGEPGDLIFNLRWDEFPQLFYYNQNVRYLWGLDARFLPNASEVIEARKNLVEGDAAPLKTLMQEIHSNILVISARDQSQKLVSALRRSGYRLRYTDSDGAIFSLPL
ncbi:MAG: hypothetical protein WC817_01550 [Patescibacteria group bacterium]|jgi:hypothetical protein